ncbi:MAG: hypothetical protein AB8B96_21770 [Lysobacterales bacterium]
MMGSTKWLALLVCLVASVYVPLASAGSIGLGFRVGLNGEDCAFFTVTDAIAAANARGETTIYINHGIYGELLGQTTKNLTFVPASPGSNCHDEDLDAASSDVMITGSDGSQGGNGGMLEVSAGARVTIRRIWLNSAMATNGGILAVTQGASLTLDDAFISDGEAMASGGLIYAQGQGETLSDVHLINGTELFRGNANNGDGGAVALFNARLTIEDSAIGVTNLTAFNEAGNNGGGVFASESEVVVSGDQSSIRFNRAGNFGGGIYLVDSSLTITDGQFEGNEAAFAGGAIYQDGSDLTITQTSFNNNITNTTQANQGGGAIYLRSGNAEIDAGVFSDNASATNGGAIVGFKQTDLMVGDSSVFDQNAADGRGGAIHALGNLSITDSVVSANAAVGFGGGLSCAVCGSVDLINTQVINNTAGNGGGLYVSGSSVSTTNIDVSHSVISENQAMDVSDSVGFGGGVWAIDADLMLNDSDIDDNTAQFSGGALYVTGAGSLSISRSQLEGNAANADQIREGGGAIYAEGLSTVSLEMVGISVNEADRNGGAMYLSDTNILAKNLTMLSNQAEQGGCIYVLDSALVLSDSVLGGCIAEVNGGAIVAGSSNLELNDVLLGLNEANRGGAMYLVGGTAVVRNSQIDRNTAIIDGGGVFMLGGALDVSSDFSGCSPAELAPNRYCSEITANEAGGRGGGIYTLGAEDAGDQTIRITHTALEDNVAPDSGAAIEIFSEFEVPPVVLESVLIANNGTDVDGSAAVFLRGIGGVEIYSSTLVGNNGVALQADDPDTPVTLQNSLIYLNDAGPQVIPGVPFVASCNNSQPVTIPSQSMNGNLGNPAFDGANVRGDYRLLPISPSVDRCVTGQSRDLDGLFRPNDGGLHDHGAFELDGIVMLPDAMFVDGFEGP